MKFIIISGETAPIGPVPSFEVSSTVTSQLPSLSKFSPLGTSLIPRGKMPSTAWHDKEITPNTACWNGIQDGDLAVSNCQGVNFKELL
ncbi:hypothetical protein TNCV_3826341 [Trichonephila clavipes]|nr:hypothetical protein TNCV_3826341 [Trichonephila clavipes]